VPDVLPSTTPAKNFGDILDVCHGKGYCNEKIRKENQRKADLEREAHERAIAVEARRVIRQSEAEEEAQKREAKEEERKRKREAENPKHLGVAAKHAKWAATSADQMVRSTDLEERFSYAMKAWDRVRLAERSLDKVQIVQRL
jgi:hypothetical protein